MPNIRYICLSDLHLGEEDSLLTNINSYRDVDTASPSPTLKCLGECIRELLKRNKPGAPVTLILNGDILELALSTMDKAILVFQQFLQALLPEGSVPFQEIIYIPGNHDHHLWETARESQYLNYISRAGAKLKPPWHTTKVFMNMQGEDRLVSRLLTAAARRVDHLNNIGIEILIAYPNYGVPGSNGDVNRAVVFHHGHFIEKIYAAMSRGISYVLSEYKEPTDIYRLEKENFAWIDFFWSTMGRSAPGVEKIYEATHDANKLQILTDHIARTVSEKHDIPYLWTNWIEEIVLRTLMRRFIVKELASRQERQLMEVQYTDLPLSDSASEGLKSYIENMLCNQMIAEATPVPDELTFVFGHTHKPGEKVENCSGYENGVLIFNTGGWIVESVYPAPLRGGSVIVIDEDLRTASVRMYNEGNYVARVAVPGSSNSLHDHVQQIMDSVPEPWRRFNSTVEAEVNKRAKAMQDRQRRLSA